MKRSGQLGIASVGFLGTVFVGGPVAFAGLWLSAILGALAASNGSKWWLLIPAAIITVCVLLFVLAVHSY